MTDTYVGLPADSKHRVAKLHATDGTDEREREIAARVQRTGA